MTGSDLRMRKRVNEETFTSPYHPMTQSDAAPKAPSQVLLFS